MVCCLTSSSLLQECAILQSQTSIAVLLQSQDCSEITASEHPPPRKAPHSQVT